MFRRVAIALTIAGACLAGCSSPIEPEVPEGPLPPTPGPATAPVIRSLSVPTARVEAGQDIAISAVVEDAETPLGQLAFQWSATAGSIAGSGPSATWQMPLGIKAGANVTVTLTVTDTYDAVENNVLIKRQFVVSQTSTAFRVHDSLAEMKELARRFLVDLFGNSSIPVEDCLVDFSDLGRCADGKQNERDDITDHREDCVVQQAHILSQNAYLTSDSNNGRVDNLAEFIDDCTSSGRSITASKGPMDSKGNYWVTTIYDQGRWWLCSSHYLAMDKLDVSGLAQIKRRRGR
jgi:hypothetical protein